MDSSGVKQCYSIDVPKENFAFRPAMIIDPIDRICYQAIIDRNSIELIGSLPPLVYGWRLPPDNPELGRYSRRDYQWRNFQRYLAKLAHNKTWGLKTDIVSYFANIDIDTLDEFIRTRIGSGKIPDRLIDLLRSWDKIPNRSGIPQRFMASSVLANMYLKPVDDILLTHSTSCRWMDDIWVFGSDASILRKAQVELQHCLEDLQLNMNFAKTRVLAEDHLVKAVKQMEHSDVDKHLKMDFPDDGPLMELVDKIIECPEQASRTSIRFAANRMRTHKAFDRVPDLVDEAHRMPHGADHLARLFHDSNIWRDLSDWYINYTSSNWATFEWAIAQLGTMFPSNEPNAKLKQYFGELLSQGTPLLPLASLAAQRLASWNTDVARAVIREAQRNANTPLQRRSLALAALMASEERQIVRNMLGEFEENQVTLKMLEDTKWRSPKTSDDFK